MPSPRVTIGIPTYERDTYLAEAISSALAQDYDSIEVLVVLDGGSNPRVDEVVAGFEGDPRVRVVRHERNRGIAAAINTIFQEGRGELIAILGDDDVCMPDRISRQVAVFDRHPDTGVVHGDAVVIDERGRQTGHWRSKDFSRQALVQTLFRQHNYLVDSSTLRHRKVFDAIGACDESLPWEDFSFHVRAARLFRYRHVGGAPVVRYRRHGENTSSDSDQSKEIELVETVLERALDEYQIQELVPELDWPVIDPVAGERRALEVLAAAFEKRGLPLPGLAARTRARARAIAVPPRVKGESRGKLMMTSFGFNDAGGGTIVPRFAAKELARRGWDVTVFYAAVQPLPGHPPYALSEREEDGVKLIGVHNRPSGFLDLGHPEREVDDPQVTAAFAAALDREQPDVIHFHNLHNLGAGLLDAAASRGIPSYFSTHNYWLVCSRLYLMQGDGSLCAGPGNRGADCAACVGCHDPFSYEDRLAQIRGRFSRAITATMAVSPAVRETLVNQGYPGDAVDVVRQGLPAAEGVWERLGRDRQPGRVGGPLTIGFFGSAYWHKGPQLLVEAAQKTSADVKIQIHGEIPDRIAQQLQAIDRRGVMEMTGHFHAGDLPGLLAGVDVAAMPSMWWDCAPLMADECLAGRVPLLAPRMGGLTQAVEDGVNGLLFDGLSAGDLAAKIDRLASEEGLLERLQSSIEPPRAFSEYVDELEAYYGGERPSRVTEPSGSVVTRWVGDHGIPTSLSIINTRVTAELDERADVQVERVARGGTRIGAPGRHAADVEVRHQWPPDLSPAQSGRLAVIQPWEFGSVPREWVEKMDANADEVWVPSEFVRSMYIESGLAADRVHVVPNGVDLDRFNPAGPRLELEPAEGVRLLFVGGFIHRKGVDVLLDAYAQAFAGRDDVTLVIKDFGGDSVYKGADRSALQEWVAEDRLPRIELIDRELSDDEMASLYRACDVLVHPYRGEGFGMPVLEAMAAGLPAIVTAGGPTDEFCPDEACWRIPSSRKPLPAGSLGDLEPAGDAWMLEPDAGALVDLMQEAVRDAGGRRARGEAAALAARPLSWPAVAERYHARILALAERTPRLKLTPGHEVELEEDADARLLAAPAWLGEDRLPELLSAWEHAVPKGASACLYLITDPDVDGDSDAILERVTSAAERGGVDLENVADITVLVPPLGPQGDDLLHARMDGYVPLHAGADGHIRAARAAGNDVLDPSAEALFAWYRGVSADAEEVA